MEGPSQLLRYMKSRLGKIPWLTPIKKLVAGPSPHHHNPNFGANVRKHSIDQLADAADRIFSQLDNQTTPVHSAEATGDHRSLKKQSRNCSAKTYALKWQTYAIHHRGTARVISIYRTSSRTANLYLYKTVVSYYFPINSASSGEFQDTCLSTNRIGPVVFLLLRHFNETCCFTVGDVLSRRLSLLKGHHVTIQLLRLNHRQKRRYVRGKLKRECDDGDESDWSARFSFFLSLSLSLSLYLSISLSI
ncbi:unnamed protein product [Acanthosepion pharaonis]|uniref:Uncharacterized protein n=1 Tax=Acanthosepion pharaonis TaxID=158019 RepID=A0A812E8P0_ACAPH|nr:unnamed protein product [Sepia pharaonis]